MSSTRSLTRISKRVNKFKGSLYESDQEDNLKDQDYNPNEFLQTTSFEVKPFNRRTSPRSTQMKEYHYVYEYHYGDGSDREYEFEEDDEEYFPECYDVPKKNVLKSSSSSALKNLKVDTHHRMVTRSSQRKF